jgi:hypothetical protein
MAKLANRQLQDPLNITGSLFGTSSYALTASFAMNGGGTNINTSSFVTTSSFNTFTQSINTATSSFVTNSQTSSFVTTSQTSSFVQNSQTSSFVQNNQTSSFVTNSQTSSFVTTSQTSSFVLNNQTSSFAITGSNNFNGSQKITGSLLISGSSTIVGSVSATSFTGSLQGTASNATYAENGSETLQEIINNSAAISTEIVGTLGSNNFFTVREQDSNNGLYIYGASTDLNKSVWIGTEGSSTTVPSPAIGVDIGSYGGVVMRGLLEVTSSKFIIAYNGDSQNGGISYISASRVTFPYTGKAVITGSLVVSGSNGGFGGITGSLFGTASYALFAANGGGTTINTGSFVTTSSFNSFTSSIKAQSGSTVSFAGSPYSASITFGTAYPNNSYAITVTGEDARIFTISSKTSSSFTINSNSSTALSGPVYWITSPFN